MVEKLSKKKPTNCLQSVVLLSLMVGTGQDGVDAGPHFLRVISIDLRLVTNSDVGHPFVPSTIFSISVSRSESRKEAFLI